MWWRDAETLDEQLDRMLNSKVPRHLEMFNAPERSTEENYSLGIALLRRHGIKAHLHPRGPYCLHYLEGLPEDAQTATEALRTAFQQADEQLQRFWAPLWTLEVKGLLRQHSRWLIRREQAIQTNARWVGELERCRMLLATTRENRDDAGTG